MSNIWLEFTAKKFLTPAINFNCFHRHCPSDLRPASVILPQRIVYLSRNSQDFPRQLFQLTLLDGNVRVTRQDRWWMRRIRRFTYWIILMRYNNSRKMIFIVFSLFQTHYLQLNFLQNFQKISKPHKSGKKTLQKQKISWGPKQALQVYNIIL